MTDPVFIVFVAASSVALYLVLWASRPTPRLIVALSVSLVLLSTSSLFQSEWATVLARIGAVCSLLLAPPRHDRTERKSSERHSESYRAYRNLVGSTTVFLGAYTALATLPHGLYSAFILQGFGIAVFLAFALLVTSNITQDSRKWGLVVPLFISVCLGLAIALVDPEMGMGGSRLRGFTSNANTMGFFSALLTLLAIYFIGSRTKCLLVFSLSVTALVWTGSRMSLVALAIGIVVLIAMKNRRALSVFLFVSLATLVLWLSGFIEFSDIAILRTENTRSSGTAELLRVLSEHPFVGTGHDSELVEVASSYFRAGVHGGIPGMVMIILIALSIAYFAFCVGGVALPLAAFGVVHAAGEGWLLSGSSPLLLVYIVALSTAVGERSSRAPFSGATARWS